MDAPNPRSERTARRPMILAIQSLSVATASSMLLWTAVGGIDGPQPKLASAGTKIEKPARASASGIAAEVQERKVKLNYFLSTPWEKVLKDVAEATDSQLIADRVPTGRFSRRDATEYTRHDAVRIINKDIEPLGFRLIEKGDFLVVIDLPSQRPRYQPVIVSKENGEEKVVDPNQAPSSPFERRVDSITTRDDLPTEPVRPDLPRRPVRKPVRQVSHDDPAAETNEQAPRRVTTAEAAAPARLDDEPAANGSLVIFRPRHRTVTDLSKQVYRALKSRAQLVSHGPNGLPAFRISTANAAPKDGDKVAAKPNPATSFTIAIDEAGDELLIEGRKPETDAMLKLLRTLDRPFDIEDPIHVAASTKYVCQIAHQLPAEIERIRAAKQQDDQPPTTRERGEVELGAGPRTRRSPLPLSLGDAIGSLKGEVTIESIDDLGVVILKGNEKDVEQVMKVIEQLEKLSEATAPKVHLLYLKNVDAESLAELLTTVYEKLTKFPGQATQPRQSAAILPVTKPNSLLIIAPDADMDSILELAEELDRPVDPLTEFQVFHLKTAIALQIEELITKFYDSEERKHLGAKILVTSDGRSNAVIVRAQPRDLDEISSLIRKLDREFSEAVSDLRIFPLKSAIALELAAVINAAIQSVIAPPTSSTGGGGGGQQQGGLQGLNPGQVDEQFRSVKSTVLEWKVGDQLLKSGMLADIRITPDSRANALIVTASAQSMALIEQLIKQLDKATPMVSVIKIFTLANADAELMVTQLNTLFNGGQAQGAGNRQNQQPGIALAGADDASASLIPLKFSVDKRTNSIVATGSADAMVVVAAILARLDESDLRARQMVVLRLQNSPATQVAAEINQFFTSQRDLTQNDPNLISSIEQLERDVVVVADTATNSLIISATPRYYEEIKSMVAKLDEAPRQVIIQALLVEVELANTDEFGIELGFQDSILFDRSTLSNIQTLSTTTTQNNVTVTETSVISQEGVPGFNFNNPSLPLGNNLGRNSNPSKVGSQGLSNFSLGRVNGDLGFGGLVLSAGSESVNALLRALSAHRRIQILSRPQIRALDNQQAEIFSGQKIPTIVGFTSNATTGVNTPTVQSNDVGIGLTCIPRVTSEGQVFMQVFAQRSQYRNEGVPLSTDAAGNTIESPILDISRANTTISVQTGQTVVIGGLISSRDEAFTNKVPFLGDIPLIGTAFRYDSRSTRRVELLVFLTPRVIGGPMDEESIKEVEMGRLHYIESEAEEIHGPLRALPAPDQVFDENGTPWQGPGMSAPRGTGPALNSSPVLPPPSVPKADDTTTNSPVIRDPAVSPAGASRLQYTEQDDQPARVTQASAEVISPSRRNQTKPPAKSGFKGWSSRN